MPSDLALLEQSRTLLQTTRFRISESQAARDATLVCLQRTRATIIRSLMLIREADRCIASYGTEIDFQSPTARVKSP